jgi:hypothetical protein
MNRLDHLLWATPDLEQSMIDWKELSGVRPARGGEHAGMGTRNALVSLNDGVYFEIIGPDPAQSLAGTLGGEFSAYEAPRLYTFAVQSGEFERAAVRLAGVGAALATPITLRRDASGTELEWRIAMIEHHSFGPLVPFLIDWGNAPHPSATAPASGTLLSLEVQSSASDELRKIYDALEIDIPCVRGELGLVASLQTPAGRLRLSSSGVESRSGV